MVAACACTVGELVTQPEEPNTQPEGVNGQCVEVNWQPVNGPGTPVKAVWSSGVPFFPPSDKYWRIGGVWYDLEPFLDIHPGGKEVLLLARDRFEDCTFVFEAHHHNYRRARAVLRRYEVTAALGAELDAQAISRRVNKEIIDDPVRDSVAHQVPQKLLDDDAFYSVLRRRATQYLQQVGCPGGDPTMTCCVLFWSVFIAWCFAWLALVMYGNASNAVVYGVLSTWLGGFGHNWVHQPKYKHWAYLSLDLIGFSSDGWFREHLMQHHMYTNTPWDNHFKGTDPFLISDPTVERNFFQKWITPVFNPVVLTFGVFGNYLFHTRELLRGNERFTVWKFAFPLTIALLMFRYGIYWGAALIYIQGAVLGIYYFTLALMNHNEEKTTIVEKRNASSDWGEAQLLSSADWGVELNLVPSMLYLGLNYHTVHHLFPRIDVSHHQGLQRILLQTCNEHNINYSTGAFWSIYRSMIRSFSTPSSLYKEVFVYAGGL